MTIPTNIRSSYFVTSMAFSPSKAQKTQRTLSMINELHRLSFRDPLQWIECVEKVQKLKPEVLIMSQARPILVREEIQEVLEIQQAIIKFLHDQTVRHMNKGNSSQIFHHSYIPRSKLNFILSCPGLFPDQIVELIKLPQALENHPIKSHSQVPTSWIIRGLFNYYMGWFSGKASELNPLSPSVAKTKWIQLLGGELNVLQHAQQALDQGELEWGLELIELLQGTNSSPESRVSVAFFSRSIPQ